MNTMFKILMAGVSCLCILAASAEENTDAAAACQISLNQMVMAEVRVCNQSLDGCNKECMQYFSGSLPICMRGCQAAHDRCTEIVDSTIDRLSSKCK